MGNKLVAPRDQHFRPVLKGRHSRNVLITLSMISAGGAVGLYSTPTPDERPPAEHSPPHVDVRHRAHARRSETGTAIHQPHDRRPWRDAERAGRLYWRWPQRPAVCFLQGGKLLVSPWLHGDGNCMTITYTLLQSGQQQAAFGLVIPSLAAGQEPDFDLRRSGHDAILSGPGDPGAVAVHGGQTLR